MYQNDNEQHNASNEPYTDEYYEQGAEVSYTDDPAYHSPEAGDDDFDKPRKRSIFKPKVKKPNFVFSVLVNSVRIFALVIVICGLALAGAVVGIAKGYMETAPTLDLALLDEQDRTSFLYDSQGNVITDYKGTENRVMVNISLMPENLRNAFVAVEDTRFYTHNGIDIKRIIGSFVQNFVSGGQQGGSTITQQLIKNTVLSNELSYKRKIQEAYLAMQLETKYSKSQILEYYLNTIYMGENYYGVQVASEGYFGKKDLTDLTLRECAMLAGLTNNPYYYNPRRNFYIRTSETTDYQKLTNDRTDYVLKCMYESQFITQQQYQEALITTAATVLQESTTEGDGMYEYAHYVEYAVRDIVDVFLEQEGLEDNSENRYKMENKLRTGGYHVTLAIDTQIQQIVEETLQNASYPALRDPSDKIYRARNNDGTYDEIEQPQSAAVVLDYRTGELKAIVGSRSKVTQRKTLNRATDMNMPIGSTIKPIAVYAPALELGYSPASIVYNIPVPIKGWTGSDGKDTWPKNYGGGSYEGAQTLRDGMKKSRNVAAAQTLVNLVGIDRSVDFLLRMGVDRDNIDATPFGLSLGSSGITPLQLTVAFGVLANGGVYQEPISFLGISDSNGNVVYDSHAEQDRRQVFRPSTSWMIVDMLKDVVGSGTGSKAKISGQTVGGKTGTNSDSRGITFSGITGWYSSAIWVGHDNYKPLSSKTTGSGGAIPIWVTYMKEIHSVKGLSDRDIVEAEPGDVGLVKATTCGVSGQLATDACRNDSKGHGTVTDYWYEPTVPTVYCQMHQSIEVCAQSGQLATSYCPNHATAGVVVIPSGHPLSTYANDPTYAPVISEYLGTASTLGYCMFHQDGYDNSGDNWFDDGGTSGNSENELMPDARQLLVSAYEQISNMDTSSNAYANVLNAISNLENIISQYEPSSSDIASGMAALTQAMSSAY